MIASIVNKQEVFFDNSLDLSDYTIVISELDTNNNFVATSNFTVLANQTYTWKTDKDGIFSFVWAGLAGSLVLISDKNIYDCRYNLIEKIVCNANIDVCKIADYNTITMLSNIFYNMLPQNYDTTLYPLSNPEDTNEYLGNLQNLITRLNSYCKNSKCNCGCK